jgi:cold shock protein
MDRLPGPDDVARAAAGEPPDGLYTRAAAEGTVKWWRSEKGTGAIACDATAPWDIWGHFSAIEMAGFKTLTPGEAVYVEYHRANQDSFRYVADRIVRLTAPPAPAAEP